MTDALILLLNVLLPRKLPKARIKKDAQCPFRLLFSLHIASKIGG
ncbi:hypothetical protein HMPREF0970_01172 [Schaalia odontolytica F0309]|uniref:Uncharacterized protein n=1 Tax=Schaalia odontolytica F0309 TaxID=649742 RepID=D4TYZ3_9ACTO|nr:hypothetical protein HMPREF0970_01172 [Schaalia odontolytica F0309]